jgi:peptidyl-prolyl cis-trans isomerase C
MMSRQPQRCAVRYGAALAIAVALLSPLPSACGGGDEGEELATIGDRKISKAQFESYLRFKRIPDKPGTQRERALEEYIEREALADAIEKSAQLDKALLETEVNEFRKEAVISRYFEKVLGDKVSDEAVRNYYETNAANYEEKKVQVAHILFRTNPKSSEEERKAKHTAAQEAHALLRSGQEFAEVARAKSEDLISSGKGGDLGWIKEGAIDPAFSKKVFAQPQGEVSEPFETPFGYHIVKVLAAPQVVRRPFEAVAGDIRHRLRNEAKQTEIKRLRSQSKVEVSTKAKQGGA